MISKIFYRCTTALLSSVEHSSLSSNQCAIPVFEGLLPEPHNTAIMDLLFTMAHWHGLAKLRMHNDLTLDLMDAETASLGIKLRKFSRHTCPAFFTKELRREYDTRLRREAKAQSASRSRQTATSDVDTIGAAGQESSSSELPSTHPVAGQPEAGVEAPANVPSTRGSGRRAKTLNLNTYKFHSYGDYVATIRRYGTMDSYSSELVCDASRGTIVYRSLLSSGRT